MNAIEIELRYEILDLKNIATFIAPFQQISTKRVVDVYFDTLNANLIHKGVFVRVRDNKKLEIKFNRDCMLNPTLAAQDYCEEYSFSLPLKQQDCQNLNAILEIVGLQAIDRADFELFKQINSLHEQYIIDKVRTSYKYNNFSLAIDEVAQLGAFLEIEYMAQDISNIEAIKQEMKTLLAGLALKPLRAGYGTLLLRKINFAHYLKSRFILEEDKKYRSSTV